MPLPIVDNFDRPNENPLSDGARWTNGIIGSGETGLYVTANTGSPARSRRRAPRGATAPSTAPTRRSGRRSPRFPGRQRGPSVRAHPAARLLGRRRVRCCERTSRRGPTRSSSSGSTTARSSPVLTINQELAAGDTLLLRAKGTTLEAWRNDGSAGRGSGSSPTRPTPRRATPASACAGRPAVSTTSARGASASANPPGKPQPVSPHLPATRSVSLTWTAPSFDGGSPITGYRVYRGTSPDGEAFLQSAGTSRATSTRAVTNGTTYYYKVSAENANGEGALSNEASATPADPSHRPRRFRRRQLRPPEREPALGRRRAGRTASSARRGDGPEHHRERARLLEVDDVHRMAQRRAVRPRPSRGRGSPPSRDEQPVRLYVRIQQPGIVRLRRLHAANEPADGHRPGPPRAHRQRHHRHRLDDQPGARRRRHPAPAREGHDHRGLAQRRLELDTTRARRRLDLRRAGYAGIGLRGTTGRLDDFGARTFGVRSPPLRALPQSLQAHRGQRPGLARLDAPSSDGGSAITGYSVYRGTSPGNDVASPRSRRGARATLDTAARTARPTTTRSRP